MCRCKAGAPPPPKNSSVHSDYRSASAKYAAYTGITSGLILHRMAHVDSVLGFALPVRRVEPQVRTSLGVAMTHGLARVGGDSARWIITCCPTMNGNGRQDWDQDMRGRARVLRGPQAGRHCHRLNVEREALHRVGPPQQCLIGSARVTARAEHLQSRTSDASTARSRGCEHGVRDALVSWWADWDTPSSPCTLLRVCEEQAHIGPCTDEVRMGERESRGSRARDGRKNDAGDTVGDDSDAGGRTALNVRAEAGAHPTSREVVRVTPSCPDSENAAVLYTDLADPGPSRVETKVQTVSTASTEAALAAPLGLSSESTTTPSGMGVMVRVADIPATSGDCALVCEVRLPVVIITPRVDGVAAGAHASCVVRSLTCLREMKARRALAVEGLGPHPRVGVRSRIEQEPRTGERVTWAVLLEAPWSSPMGWGRAQARESKTVGWTAQQMEWS
ncbi:hypothetical protein B0H21DRAFT_707715 [Amylocystis lapponica]|nr:hypothetical protein B0H21DRAFT_707715 [Amylocystis lapponica]